MFEKLLIKLFRSNKIADYIDIKSSKVNKMKNWKNENGFNGTVWKTLDFTVVVVVRNITGELIVLLCAVTFSIIKNDKLFFNTRW